MKEPKRITAGRLVIRRNTPIAINVMIPKKMSFISLPSVDTYQCGTQKDEEDRKSRNHTMPPRMKSTRVTPIAPLNSPISSTRLILSLRIFFMFDLSFYIIRFQLYYKDRKFRI